MRPTSCGDSSRGTQAGLAVRSRFPGRASLGLLQTDQSSGALRISGPTRIGSAAYRAGLDVDDEFRGINGQNIGTAEQLEAALKKVKPGDRVTVSFLRRGQPVIADVVVDEDPRIDIVTVESAGGTLTPAQRAFRASWLTGN